MSTNGPRTPHKEDKVSEKLLEKDRPGMESPKIKFRNPGRSSTCRRRESIRLKRFDLIADDISVFQAAREGRVKVLNNLKDSGENLVEKDNNGFASIHHAARANQVESIEFFLDSGVDVDFRGGIQQLTPLHISVRFNCLEATKFLLSNQADPSIKSSDGTSPLHIAARHAIEDICQLLLGDHRSDVNVPDNSGVTAFHLVCVSGSTELFQLFLNHGADILAVSAEQRNPLHIASLYGHTRVVERLVKAAKDQNLDIKKFINSLDSENNTPLHLACKNGHLDVVKVCIQYHADLEARNDIVFNTPLHVASKAGQPEIIQVLIDAGSSVTSTNGLRRLPIHLASIFGHSDSVNCLLENGSPIDPRDSSSSTPFLSAVMAGRLLVTRQLISIGADTEARTESLQNCIHLAIQNKKMDMLELLVGDIGNEIVNNTDKDLRVPLHHCAYAGLTELLVFLLSKCFDHHPKDIFGRTPLHMAAENGNIECVKALAETSRFHIGDTDDNNSTPLLEAAKKGRRNVCKYLLRMGADVTSKDTNRWTALHHAAHSGHVKTVEVLLKSNAVGSNQTIDEQDSEGNTPLIVAAKNGHVDIVRLLISQEADVTVRNKRKMTCLDEAVERKKMAVVSEIVHSERWFEVVSHRPHEDKYPMKNLIENMPQAAREVLDRCIDFSEHSPDDPEYTIKCDFRLLDSLKSEEETLGKKSENHFYAPTTMINQEREDLLNHPLLKAFLTVKWKRIGRPLTNLGVIMYLVYVGLFTSFLVDRRRKRVYYKDDDGVRSREQIKRNAMDRDRDFVFPAFLTFLIISMMIKELVQLYSQGRRYFKSMGNYLDWASYILAVCFMVPHLQRGNPYAGTGIIWPLGASAVLFMYFTLFLLLRCFGFIGIYISMFIEILKTLGKVLVVFSIFVFSFSLVFFTLLKEQKSFRSLGWAFIKTTMMVIGDMDFDALITENLQEKNPDNEGPLVPAPEFTSVMLMLFGFFMAVLFMNLLVGLAVGDIDGIQQNASFKRKVMKVELIVELEDKYPRKLSEMLGITPIMVFRPNRPTGMFKYPLFRMLYSISPEKLRAARTTEEPCDLASELKEQKARTKELQESIIQQNKLLLSMSKKLQAISGLTSPGIFPLDTTDFGARSSQDHGTTLTNMPPSLL